MASLVVIDPHARAYDDESIFHQPLAGTPSAVLETCLALAEQIDTTLFNGVADDKHAGRLRLKASHRVAVGWKRSRFTLAARNSRCGRTTISISLRWRL